MTRTIPSFPCSIIRIGWVVALAIAMVSGTQTSLGAEPAQSPNVLLILSDDHSGAHLGCYGNKDIRTPHLDRLASQGMHFDRAYVTCPQCVPSRASILSGRHPIDIAMSRFSAPLPRDVKVFPERLRAERGYYAGLCGRGYHLGGRLLDDPAVRPHLVEADFPNMDKRLDYVKIAGGADVRGQALQQFNEFLDQVPGGKPFFLQLGWSDPHRPFTTEDLPVRHDPATLALPPFFPDAEPIRRDLASYYDEIARLDGDVGAVLKILDDRKLAENTIVIFMGDNGASQLRGKGTLNEFGIRVPLIVRWPGVVKPGTSTTALVSGEDLAPTLLEAVGLQPAENLSGFSFLPLMRDHSAKATRSEVVSERGPHGTALPRGAATFDLGRSMTTDRYKLIYNALWQIPYQPVDFNLDEVKKLQASGKLSPELEKLYLAPQRPMFELYDLQEDPWEMNNLASRAATKEVEQDLKGRLTAWMIHHRDFLPLPMSGQQSQQRKRAD